MQNEILFVCRPGDKKKVMFYNDKSATIDINEDFKKMWRSIAVENMDDEKIEEHLEKQVCFIMCNKLLLATNILSEMLIRV